MNRNIFLNLPVKDLKKSRAFFSAMGYTFNEQFSDDTAACCVISETIYAMLLRHPKFEEFSPNAICDTSKNTEVLIALSCESREEVDDMIKRALSAGGSNYKEATDYGFMYSHGFRDLDGHIWEVFWMDPKTVNPT